MAEGKNTRIDNNICGICNSENRTIVGKPQTPEAIEAFTNRKYNISRCDDCYFYYVVPRIDFTENTWSKLYGDDYFYELTSWWSKKRDKDIQERFDLLEKYYSKPIENFLDIGSGEGLFLIEAVNREWNACGIDISDNRIEEARTKAITFFNGNLFDAKYSNNQFDCVYMDSVLEHLEDPLKIMQEVHRILKPAGLVYIGVPNEGSLFNYSKKYLFPLIGKRGISPFIKPFVPPYHINGFTKISLPKIVSNSNFDVLELRTFGSLYEIMKHKIFTKGFIINLALFPIHFVSSIFDMQIYMDAIIQKK